MHSDRHSLRSHIHCTTALTDAIVVVSKEQRFTSHNTQHLLDVVHLHNHTVINMLDLVLTLTLFLITLHIVKSDMPTTSRPSLSTVNIPLPTDQQLIDGINAYCDHALESLDDEPTPEPRAKAGRKTNAWHAEQMDNTLTLSAGSIDTLKVMLEALPTK